MSAASLLVWFVAALGHAALCVHAANWMQSTRFRGWWLKSLRRGVHLLNVGLPFLLLWYWPGLISRLGAWLELPMAVQVYVAFVLLVGGFYVPTMLVRRWGRRPPAHLRSATSVILRPGAPLPERAYGPAKRAWLARLPGNEIFEVEVAQCEVTLPRLPPAWDGLTLLHVSDLHFLGVPNRVWFEAVMDYLGRVRADLVLITGDIVDSPRHYHWIRPLLGRLRWRLGAFAVLGNHDSYLDVDLIQSELRATQIEPIGGQWRTLEHRGASLTFFGNELPWLRPAPDLGRCPRGDFRLCLSHSPDQLDWARRHEVDLMLCGHNHGGQFRVPGIGSIFVPSRYSGRHDQGLYWEPPTLLHVSRGLAGTYPIRWRCRPEATWLTLRAAQLHDDAARAEQLVQMSPPALTVPLQPRLADDVAQL